MRIVYMGTPDFAVPCLLQLIASAHTVIGVFTQPDKPVGRKQIMTPPDVKVCALEHQIPVYQPNTLRDGKASEIIRELDPDVIVVAAYGKIIPKDILGYPRYGCINIHGSLLPKYRGAAPIQWSVINGDAETGITIMQMNEGVDTGDILYQKAIPIGINDTAESMFEKLSVLGAEMILDVLDKLPSCELSPRNQDETQATYAPMLSKEIAAIDWNKPSALVHDLVRGLYSWPIAYTYLDGKKLKIYRTSPCDKCAEVGRVIATDPLTVACGEGSVIIHELQLEGKKRMDAATFLIGHPLQIGDRLGDRS